MQRDTGTDMAEAVDETPSSGGSDSLGQDEESGEDENGEITAALQRVLALETSPEDQPSPTKGVEEANDSQYPLAKPVKRRNRYKSVISQVHEHAVRLGMNVEFEVGL